MPRIHHVQVTTPNSRSQSQFMLERINRTNLPQQSADLQIFGDDLGLYASSSDAAEGVATTLPGQNGRLYWSLRFDSLATHGSLEAGARRRITVTEAQRQCFALPYICRSMSVVPACCEEAVEALNRPNGITIGDVVDFANRIVAEHEHCPFRMRDFDETHFAYPTFLGVTLHDPRTDDIGATQEPEEWFEAPETAFFPSRDANPASTEGRFLSSGDFQLFGEENEEDENDEEDRLREVAMERMMRMADLGWSNLWREYEAARNDQEVGVPIWPLFILQNAHLLRESTRLNGHELTAPAFIRERPQGEYGNDDVEYWEESDPETPRASEINAAHGLILDDDDLDDLKQLIGNTGA